MCIVVDLARRSSGRYVGPRARSRSAQTGAQREWDFQPMRWRTANVVVAWPRKMEVRGMRRLLSHQSHQADPSAVAVTGLHVVTARFRHVCTARDARLSP